MKIIVLGSGTSVPHPRRASAAYWVETETGALLLDMSADAPHRMAQENLDWPNLSAIWISHFHLDHIGGLAPFLFGARWAPQMHDRTKPLTLYGPEGLAALIKRFDEANNYKLFEQLFPLQLTEIRPGQEFEILSGVTASAFSTPHTPESLAIRLTDANGKTLLYTSDTGFSEDLIDFARGVGLLLMECSFRRNKPLQTHLELKDAMLLARKAQPQKVILTHLYPEWDDIDVREEARRLWPGDVIEAVDGLRLEI